MDAIGLFVYYNQKYIDLITNFFSWYNLVGRKILDVFHAMFDGVFNILLVVAVFFSLLYFMISIYTLFRGKKKQKIHQTDTPMPSVTVQIPTYNELVAIRCAKACLEFDYPKDKYEIIIGDDSSDPSITQKLKEFGEESGVIIIKRESNKGFKPANLNNMLNHSKGEILVIFDSDFVPQKDFLSRIVEPFRIDKSIAGVQARWKLINSNHNMVSVLGATIVSTCHQITLPFIFDRRKISFLCGSAEAVRKDLVIGLGRWEEGNLTEDIEFSLRLLENGYKVQYLEDLECESEVPYTLKDLYRQQMRWAYGVVYSWKKHLNTIVKTKKLSTTDKFFMGGIFCSGYLLSVLLAGLFISGTLSFVTHAPGPIEWRKFAYEMVRNVLLTSGLIIASIVALSRANQKNLTLRMIASSFSYGLVVTYYVNIGIFKAFAKSPMKWYMLNKHGNQLSS